MTTSTVLTVTADELRVGDLVSGKGRVIRANPVDDGWDDEDLTGFQTEDGREYVVRADAPYEIERGGNRVRGADVRPMCEIGDLVGTSMFTPAAFATPGLHTAYLHTHLTFCDCHTGVAWHDADVVVRAREGVIECPLPADRP